MTAFEGSMLEYLRRERDWNSFTQPAACPFINESKWLIAYRHLGDPGPDHFGYPGEGGRRQQPPQQHQTNSRQKNPLTAAV